MGSENRHPSYRQRRFILAKIYTVVMVFALLFLFACQMHPTSTPSLTATPFPVMTITLSMTPESVEISPTIVPTVSGNLPVWGNFAAPTMNAVTAIPPPFSGLTLSSDIQTLVLLGSDQDVPYEGRTTGIVLVFVNPRLAKVSLVSVPGNLFVYIPGYTMQRINVAYSIGGLSMLFKTLEYNFGVHPDHWALVHPSDFASFIDDLEGLDVPVLVAVPDLCGGLPAGTVHMNGAQALCYVSFRQGNDEIDRSRRLQQMLRLLFLRMVDNGNLTRLPELFSKYQQLIHIDLNQEEVTSYIPLALKLGDPQRVFYFQIGWGEVTSWQLPDQPTGEVLLPRSDALLTLLQQAVDDVNIPAPLSDRVTTLVYELTISPTPTLTPIPSETPSETPTITFTPYRSPTPTISLTPTRLTTLTISLTPTRSITPTISHTPTVTQTPNGGYP